MTIDTLPRHHVQPDAHTQPHSNRNRLALSARRILQFNALTGIVSGPILVVGAAFLSPLLGLDQFAAAIPVIRATGVSLVLFAALLLWIARRPVAPITMLAIGTVDAVWVAASVALVLSRILPLSATGVWIVIVQADVIALLAALELHSWWRTRT